jgi:YesN/AraC family two-component response regulator
MIKPMQILIVDDNELVRRGVSTLLSSRPGWQVCGHAVDGKEAVRKAKEFHPDLILLDISMPGSNGLEVAVTLGIGNKRHTFIVPRADVWDGAHSGRFLTCALSQRIPTEQLQT